MKPFEIAVIGAGMFGSAAAKYLSKEMGSVALVGPDEPKDKQVASSQLSFGAYYDQARITRRLGWDEVWGTTDARSLNRYRSLENESGVPFFYERGSLVVMANSIVHRTNFIVNHCQENQIPVERLTVDKIASYWSYLQMPHIVGGVEGLYEEQMAGYLNPRKLVEAQLTLFQRNGGILMRGNVTCVEKESDLWHITVDKTNVLYAKQVLLATGSFINHNALLPGGCKLELYSFTEPNLLFEVAPDDLTHMLKMPTIITVDPEDTGNHNLSTYLLPPILYPDGKWYIRIGPGMQPIVQQLDTLEEMRKWYIDQRVTLEQRHFLLQMKEKLFPYFKPRSIQEACCIIEKTPSHYPYLGPLSEDTTLQVVTGGNGHGARGSDEIGRLAAGMMLGNRWDFPIDKSLFTPVLANGNECKLVCKPPFGLC